MGFVVQYAVSRNLGTTYLKNYFKTNIPLFNYDWKVLNVFKFSFQLVSQGILTFYFQLRNLTYITNHLHTYLTTYKIVLWNYTIEEKKKY